MVANAVANLLGSISDLLIVIAAVLAVWREDIPANTPRGVTMWIGFVLGAAAMVFRFIGWVS